MKGPAARRPLAAMHDMELVSLSASGERAAFGELARRHGTLVRALLRRMGADSATADDVAQDAFLTAYERIAEFRGEGAFAGWVRRIAARLYVKRRMGRLRQEVSLEPSDQEASGEDEGAAADRLDLDEALAALAPIERLCVSLCYGAGLTHPEIAEATGAPLGTVKSHVRRGLEKLRRRMGAPPAPAAAAAAASPAPPPAQGVVHG